jgi:phosphohistidine swiveling domain-containing protein
MIATSRYLLSLDDPECADPRRAGAKAAVLASLSQDGFDVPEGFVLTTEAYLAAGGATEDRALPEAVERALLKVADHFEGAPLAVRSSAEAEDLRGSSFAGQYDTVLGVRGAAELTEAVRRVWASASSARVAAYRERQRPGAPTAMAVLIQRLIQAETAGVAFSADPVTGDPSTTIVEAVVGLGDRAVAGAITPERWRVDMEGEPRREGPAPAVMDRRRAEGVIALARRAASHLGQPQDVEWAAAEGTIWLLQARPITTLRPTIEPVPVAVEVPNGFWQREASHFPSPHSPLSRSIFFLPRNEGLRQTFEDMGALLETLDFREIGGWEYFRLVPMGGKDRPAPPAAMLGLLARLVPAMRKRAKAAREYVRADKSAAYIRRWHEEWRPAFQAEIVRLRDIDRGRLSDEELDRQLGDLGDFFARTAEVHFLLHAAVALPIYELAITCRDVLGWDDQGMCRLLSGLSPISTEPARRLAELTKPVESHPGLAELLRRPRTGVLERIEREYPDFAAAFHAYRREYGCRALRYDVAEPTLGENPELLLKLIGDQVAASIDPEKQVGDAERARIRAEDEAQRLLASRSVNDRHRFEAALRRAQMAYPVREDNEWYTASAPLALVRFAAQEAGKRLASRGQIESANDVFFLEMAELRGALREKSDQREVVRRRKGERAWVEAHAGPAAYGPPPGSPPSFDALPREVHLVNQGILWYVDRITEAARSGETREGDRLQGVAASPGRYEGTVRVIMGEDQFSKLEPGDVVVCPTTSPVWSVVFPNMGALVTDTGGILSHPAIIAREYGVPAVVATGNATAVLRDGERVAVDGSAGVVERR